MLLVDCGGGVHHGDDVVVHHGDDVVVHQGDDVVYHGDDVVGVVYIFI